MTALLLRLFVKDHRNTASPAVRAAIGKLAGATGIACNMLLFAFKLTLGILSGSVAIMADAANNLSDISSSLITLVAFRISQKPADRDHPYGHARYEYLAGLAVAFLILLIGSQLVVNSMERIVTPAAVTFTPVTLIILAVSALLKLWMSLFFRTLGKRIRSTALAATAIDCRNDVLATAAVLTGGLIFAIWHINIDAYIGLAVAVFILYSGFKIARETISPLLGAQADKDLVDRLCTLISSHNEILGFHDLLIHDYGPGRCFASVHVELSCDNDVMTAHNILDAIEREAMNTMNVQLVIHFDPVDTEDSHLCELRQTVDAVVAAIDRRMTVHDVRFTDDGCLQFDVSLPYSMKQHDDIKARIDDALAARGVTLETVISFDEHDD